MVEIAADRFIKGRPHVLFITFVGFADYNDPSGVP